MSVMLERLREFDAQLIQQFLTDKKSLAIPLELQEYIIKVNAVPAIIHHNPNSMTVVVRELQKQFKGLSYSQARDIYYDAMNFFYVDDAISADAWDNFYAEQQEKLARLAISLNKVDAASKCFQQARSYRIAAAERIKPGEWKAPVFILTNKIRPEDLNIKSQKIYDIIRKDEEGKYSKMINGLPISEAEKKRLKNDAGIQEAEIIEEDCNEE